MLEKNKAIHTRDKKPKRRSNARRSARKSVKKGRRRVLEFCFRHEFALKTELFSSKDRNPYPDPNPIDHSHVTTTIGTETAGKGRTDDLSFAELEARPVVKGGLGPPPFDISFHPLGVAPLTFLINGLAVSFMLSPTYQAIIPVTVASTAVSEPPWIKALQLLIKVPGLSDFLTHFCCWEEVVVSALSAGPEERSVWIDELQAMIPRLFWDGDISKFRLYRQPFKLTEKDAG